MTADFALYRFVDFGVPKSFFGPLVLSHSSHHRRQTSAFRAITAGSYAAGLLFAACLIVTGPVNAANLELVVDVQDGSLFLRNSGESDEVFDGYSFSSPDAFLPGGLTPIAGSADVVGDGSIDSFAQWIALGPQTAFNLAEASAVAGSGSLAPGQVVSFGQVYDLSQPAMLTAQITQGLTEGPSPTPILIDLVGEFRDLGGDYNGDLTVDPLDFDLFVSTFGSTVDLRADGNNDGVVNTADYAVWRDSLAASVSPAPITPVFPLAVAVPEPSTVWLALTAGAACIARRRA